MRKMFGLLGATVGGWVGWVVGAPMGTIAAFMLSMVGTGVGMYAGIRLAMHYS